MTSLDAYGLTARQQAYGLRVSEVARELIAPLASDFDERQCIPREIFTELAREGYLAANVAEQYGGRRVDQICLGLLHHGIGAACTSVRSVLTVHGMVCEVLQRWGTAHQKAQWLPQLASGTAIGAFALTEVNAGSDARAVATTAVESVEGYCLTGSKCWITGGEMADVFVVIARGEQGIAGFLVTPDSAGFLRTPVRGMLGQRGAMLASVDLNACVAPADRRLGRAGFGFEAIVGTALDFGRYTVAWGCVGLAQACLELSLRHASDRVQIGRPLAEHQLVRAMITEMVAGVRTAGLLSLNAARLRELGVPEALQETCLAKYVAAQVCVQAASHCVQIHGASGCAAGHASQRHYRDAKIMEIIEGSTQIQQDLIARLAYDAYYSVRR